MSDPAQLALARKAIADGVTGCYEWDGRQAERVRNDARLQGLTPEYLRQRLREHVCGGGAITQHEEKRPEYSYRDYWYKAILPESGFKHGVFIELELTDPDPDLPAVTIWNAHPQVKR